MPINPMYSEHLGFAPTFRWGGREWGPNDAAAFRRKMGKRYPSWARAHPNAAKVFDPVEQDIYSLIQPEITGIEAERAKRRDYYDRQMRNLGGFYAALGGMLGGVGPAIRGTYTEGGNTMSALGTGYGDVLNRAGATNAASLNEVLGAIGAPEGQTVQGGDPGGVLQGVAGWLPEAMMDAQGSAYGAAADQLPKTAGLEAQIMMKDLLRQSTEEDQDFSTEILKVLQGLPGMRSELRSQQQAANLDRQAFKLKQIEADRDFWLKKQALYLSQGKLKLAAMAEQRAQQAENRYQMESAGRDAWGNPMPGYTEGPNGSLIPPGYRVDKNGNVVKQYAGDSGGKGGKFTPGQRQEMIENIHKQEEAIKDLVVKAIQDGEWYVGSGPPAPGARAKLGRKLFERFSHLAPTPTAKKVLRKLIQRVLNEAQKAVKASGGTPDTSGSFWD